MTTNDYLTPMPPQVAVATSLIRGVASGTASPALALLDFSQRAGVVTHERVCADARARNGV